MDDVVVAGLRDEREVHAAYLLYGPQLYRFLLRGLRDPGAAQDVTQETFLQAPGEPRTATTRPWRPCGCGSSESPATR